MKEIYVAVFPRTKTVLGWGYTKEDVLSLKMSLEIKLKKFSIPKVKDGDSRFTIFRIEFKGSRTYFKKCKVDMDNGKINNIQGMDKDYKLFIVCDMERKKMECKWLKNLPEGVNKW